jgi:hypothetical protein
MQNTGEKTKSLLEFSGAFITDLSGCTHLQNERLKHSNLEHDQYFRQTLGLGRRAPYIYIVPTVGQQLQTCSNKVFLCISFKCLMFSRRRLYLQQATPEILEGFDLSTLGHLLCKVSQNAFGIRTTDSTVVARGVYTFPSMLNHSSRYVPAILNYYLQHHSSTVVCS